MDGHFPAQRQKAAQNNLPRQNQGHTRSAIRHSSFAMPTPTPQESHRDLGQQKMIKAPSIVGRIPTPTWRFFDTQR
ncbi:hypothetical protein BC937DRAFT_92820 [Endogone sp. FLAS-F59071]|nr:hypothetical protein BC937DRAFT_92820 [Endogone sp. FLAS-F59071]|eukprot:RUS23061.1 hypothetical protein BC937DRAFT_92820 [Endogone sp. FLAS-F59071]